MSDFETSQELDKIGPALVRFQQMVKDPRKDARNPHFNSKFVPLEGAIESLRPALNECGISVTQWHSGAGLVTMLLHESGQYIRGTAELVLEKQSPQGLGSAITYERRYSLLAATGTSGDVDDDAEAAHGRGQQAAPRQPQGLVLQSAPPAPKERPLSDHDKKLIDRFVGSIGGATNIPGLRLIGESIGASDLSKSAKDELKGLYSAKLRELESITE
ncbi:MAG TPA: ERF family protein [Phycisphaerae bacterium]|nr:ERF family protein [Phycisphaerae bacterium]HUU94861.1 ERF family protein [Phycisphaerae bacterium]